MTIKAVLHGKVDIIEVELWADKKGITLTINGQGTLLDLDDAMLLSTALGSMVARAMPDE